MKKVFKLSLILLVTMGLVSTALGVNFDIPRPSTEFYVYDEVGVISRELEKEIIQFNQALNRDTGAQIVVAVVDNIEGSSGIEEYANLLFKEWEIGDAQEDNGILFVTSIEDRLLMIEVGYGLEGALPDGKVGEIADVYIAPYFREDNFSEGIRNGFYALAEEVRREYNLEGTGVPEPSESTQPDGMNSILRILGIIALLILIFVDMTFFGGTFTFLILRSIGRGASSGGGTSGGGGSSGGGGASRRF